MRLFFACRSEKSFLRINILCSGINGRVKSTSNLIKKNIRCKQHVTDGDRSTFHLMVVFFVLIQRDYCV